jgi:hypothetical protein
MNLSPLPIQKFFGNNGRPLAGGLLFTYVAGTNTKVATYTDASGLSQNTNPIVLDFRGECRLWIDPQLTYKFILSPPGDTDPPTRPIWSVDNITAAPQAFDNAAVDTGSVNNISLNIPQISSPVAFTRVVFKAANTNTGDVTLQINGGTAYPLVWSDGTQMSYGNIRQDGIYQAIFDGGSWQLQGQNLEPIVNVLKHGADNTGTSDSYAAIITAIQYARTLRSLWGATTVSVYFPDGVYSISQGIPLVTGVNLIGQSYRSVAIECTGSTAAIYTATYSAGVFSDNLNADISEIQNGTKAVDNCTIENLFVDHIGIISGNAPSGVPWNSVVQLVGAPDILINHVTAACDTSSKDGISLKFSWRAQLYRPVVARNSGNSGGFGILLDSQTNACLITGAFVVGNWGIGIDAASSNSVTIIEPSVELGNDIGVRLGGVSPRLIGGYYEGNGVDISLGVPGSACENWLIEHPWFNGAASQVAIDFVSCIRGEVRFPYFTGSYSVSRYRQTGPSTENYANVVNINVANANAPDLASLGLIGGRNFIRCYGDDFDDFRMYQEYRSTDGSPIQLQLNQRGAAFVMFELWIQNTGGVLQVAITDGDEQPTAYDTCFLAISATLINQADVSAGSGFPANTPAGRLSGSNSVLVLNTGNNILGFQSFMMGSIYTNNGTALSAICRLRSRNIGGVTSVRPEISLRNAATGAAFDFDTVNFAAGEFAHIPIIGFIN